MAFLTSDPVEGTTARPLPVEQPAAPEPGPQLVPPRGPDERRILRRATLQQNVEFAVWVASMAVIAAGIFWHEPWADEAQAWLLARDQGFWHLLLHAVRYEGTPGLWHALLWALVRVHVSYVGMHWIAGALAAAGIYVFLRWSPFPLVLRILLPFGFWLAYQDAVVARSYVLYALLVFSAAAILRRISQTDPRWPLGALTLPGLALLLGLMANLSVHGFVASLGFAIVAWVLLRRRSRAGTRAQGLAPLLAPGLILGAFLVFALATTVPPRSADFVAAVNFQRSLHRLVAKVDSRAAGPAIPTRRQDVRPGELTPVANPVNHWTRTEAFGRKAARVLAVVTFPVSNFRWFALAAVVLIVVQAAVFGARPGQLGWVGLVPWALLVAAFTSIYLAPRHAGMVWETLLASLWLTWPDHAESGTWRLWLHRAVAAVLVLVAAGQVWWTGHGLWGDIRGPSSGDVALAKFLAAEPSGARTAGFYYHTVGAEAYFSRPLYFNQPTAYWFWSRDVRTNQQAAATIATHPDVIVVGRMHLSRRNGNILDDWIAPDPAQANRNPWNDDYGILPWAEAHGYRETHRFCGYAFMRDGYDEHLCQFVLEPAP